MPGSFQTHSLQLEAPLVEKTKEFGRFYAITEECITQSLCLSQHYSSKEGGIHLAVIDSSHLMISSGTMIFVSDTQVVCSNVFTHVCLGEFLFVGC